MTRVRTSPNARPSTTSTAACGAPATTTARKSHVFGAIGRVAASIGGAALVGLVHIGDAILEDLALPQAVRELAAATRERDELRAKNAALERADRARPPDWAAWPKPPTVDERPN